MSDEFTLRGVAVGDTLFVRDYRDRRRETKVTKIGRTLVHCEHGWQTEKYAIADGVESRPANAIGAGGRAFTREGWERYEYRSQVESQYRAAIRAHTHGLSTEQMEQVIAILTDNPSPSVTQPHG